MSAQFHSIGNIFYFGPNFTEVRELILVLMSNACYLVVILIFWWLLGGYGLLPSGYCWLMLAS